MAPARSRSNSAASRWARACPAFSRSIRTIRSSRSRSSLASLGVAILMTMWLWHLALFRGGGLIAWVGIVIVVQNLASAPFNSHLFDSFHGWLYVFRRRRCSAAWCCASAEGGPRMIALARTAAHSRRRAAAARRRAAHHAADPQPQARVAGCRDRRAGVPRHRRHSRRQSRHCRMSSRCRSDPSAGESLRAAAPLWRALRSRALDAERRSADAVRVGGGPPQRRVCRCAGRRWRGSSGWRSTVRSRSRTALHRVHEVLRLAEAIGVTPVPEVVAPSGATRPASRRIAPYAVIHAAPMFRYKRWTDGRLAGACGCARRARARGDRDRRPGRSPLSR